MDERVFYRETDTTHTLELNCPYCKSSESYDLRWRVRLRKDQLPGGADERDRARFAKALSYMVLLDDKVSCKNSYCRRSFDVSGIKTTAFLSQEQEETFRQQKSQPVDRGQRGHQGGRPNDRRPGGQGRGGRSQQKGPWGGPPNRGGGGRGGGGGGRRGGGGRSGNR